MASGVQIPGAGFKLKRRKEMKVIGKRGTAEFKDLAPGDCFRMSDPLDPAIYLKFDRELGVNAINIENGSVWSFGSNTGVTLINIEAHII